MTKAWLCRRVARAARHGVPRRGAAPRDPQEIVKQIQALGMVHGRPTRTSAVSRPSRCEGLSFLDGPNTRKFLELT